MYDDDVLVRGRLAHSKARFLGTCAALCLAGCLLTIDESLITEGGGGSGQGAAPQAGGEPGGGGAGGGAEAPGLARILYTDVEGGPGDGGKDGLGAFVSIVGRGFGQAQGASTVTIGGGLAGAIVSWSDNRIVAQVGAAAATGDLVVHVEGDGASNAVPFEVRPGKIYFVDALGDDTGEGTFEAPFETVAHCLQQLAPGGFCYVHGTVETDAFNLALPSSSQVTAPKTLASFPGETALFSASFGNGLEVCNNGCGNGEGAWVFAGLRVEAPAKGLRTLGATGVRVADTAFVCSSGSASADCVMVDDGSSAVRMFGLSVAVANADGPSSVTALSVGSVSDVEIGWSAIRGPGAGRGIGLNGVSDFEIHDNLVTDVLLIGIDLNGFDGDAGRASLYNNVVYGVTQSSDTSACMRVGSASSRMPPPLSHNTLFDCGRPLGACLDTRDASALVRNNIFVQPDQSELVKIGGFAASVGSDNLFQGGGALPAPWTNNIVGDPGFVAPETGDFHLGAGSDAKDRGSPVEVELDRDGYPRDATPDVGAYELH